MNRILRIWRASFTRRWHQNFDLGHTDDPVGGHQGRTALLVLALFPECSRQLLAAALTHDQGEMAAADVSFDAKFNNPALKELLDGVEAGERDRQDMSYCDNLSSREEKILKMCDWLDAWLWMMRHARHLYARSDWQAQLRWGLEQAEQLCVVAEVQGLIDAEVAR